MDQKHKKILRKNRPKLEEDLLVDDIWSQLISYEVFVPADYGEMFNPNRKPMATMLDKLEQKGHTAFRLFVKAVSESGKAHLLDCLNDKEFSQEFQAEPDLNVSDQPRSCTGDCTEKIRQLREENAQLLEMNRATEASKAKQATDYRMTTYLLLMKNSMLMAQNEHFYNGQNLLFYQNRQLMSGNTSLTNEVQQMKSQGS